MSGTRPRSQAPHGNAAPEAPLRRAKLLKAGQASKRSFPSGHWERADNIDKMFVEDFNEAVTKHFPAFKEPIMSEARPVISAAWEQFLIARRAMLAQYDQAFTHAQTQSVQTHHGVVGRAAVRDWLATFLPQKFGVTCGYIRSQDSEKADNQSSHYDVIIYDKMEAPILWIEDNKDKSENGLARIIPVEFVRGIIEVKAAFNRALVRQAVEKITGLDRFMAGIDAPGERYPKYLCQSVVLCILCFEMRAADVRAKDNTLLHLIRDVSLPRHFYGAVVLRGEGINPDLTAIIEPKQFSEPFGGFVPEGTGLFQTISFAATDEDNRSARMTWLDINFSKFAFDILALLNETYESGSISSRHGLDIPRFFSTMEQYELKN